MLQSCTRTRRNNQSGERLDKQCKDSREEITSTNANRTTSVSGNNASITDSTKWFASEKEVGRRASGNKIVKTMHSCEALGENNSTDSPRSRPRPPPQAVPSHTAKVLAAHSDKDNNESHLSMSDLSEEDGIGRPRTQVTEGCHVLDQDQRAIGNPLARLLRESEPPVQRVQLHPLL